MATDLVKPLFILEEWVCCRSNFYTGKVKAVWFDDFHNCYRYVVVSPVHKDTMMVSFETDLSPSKGIIVIPSSCGRG